MNFLKLTTKKISLNEDLDEQAVEEMNELAAEVNRAMAAYNR